MAATGSPSVWAGVRAVIPSLALLACLIAWVGCAHYQLGTGATPAFRTLYVAPVANQTLLPQSQALMSTQLREAFLRDGRVTLVNSAEAADATLTIVLNDYHREVAASRADDTGLARKFNLTLGALCSLQDRRSGKTIFENRPVRAQREVFTDSGQLQAEYQTLPLLADALAARILHATLDVW
jgi:Lipopolysaccharide-assembly